MVDFKLDRTVITVTTTDRHDEDVLPYAAFGFPTTPVTPQDIVIGRKVIHMGVPPVQLHVMSAIDGATIRLLSLALRFL